MSNLWVFFFYVEDVFEVVCLERCGGDVILNKKFE